MLVVEDKFNCKKFPNDEMRVEYNNNDTMNITITEFTGTVDEQEATLVLTLEDFRKIQASVDGIYGAKYDG